jgi:hypothetical protein
MRKKNPKFVYAPFTPEQIESLNGYQPSGVFHPFTCGNDACKGSWQVDFDSRLLVVTTEGWKCPSCDYTQDWAWRWMADNSWREVLKEREAIR